MALLADLLLILHASLVLFVLLFPLLVVLGRPAAARRSGWRLLHLLCIAVIAVQSWFAFECPLTTWENLARRAAGQTAYSDQGFIAHWLHRLIFFDAPPWVFVLAYSLFLGLVLLTFWRWPLQASR